MNTEKINYCFEKRDYILKHYERHFDNGCFAETESFRYLDWESRDSQFTRFYVLLESIQLHGKSILDVGCGLGDLYKFLDSLNINFVYKGLDFSQKCIEKCRDYYPQGEFECRDIFMETGSSNMPKFDIVFCSGMFNLNVENNYELLKYALKLFYRMAKQHVVFNLLSTSSRSREDRYFYFSPQEVSDIVSAFPFAGVKIIEDYLENDFTLVCSKM